MTRKLLSGAAVAAAAIAVSASPAAAARHAYSAADEQWLQSSMQGDHFEIEGGHLAADHASADAAKAIGARYVKDHSSSLKEAKALARKLGIKRESEPTPSEKWELGEIAGFTGAEFDKRYVSLEVADHQQDIQETKDEISGGSNRQVVAAARKELKMLRKHLKLAEAAASAIGI